MRFREFIARGEITRYRVGRGIVRVIIRNSISESVSGPKLTAPATPEVSTSLPDTPGSLDDAENARDSLPPREAETEIDPESLYFRLVVIYGYT